MTSTSAPPPVAPPVESLVPAAVHALARELGTAPGTLRVIASNARSYSHTWELEAASGRYILKWLPLRAHREAELARICRGVFSGHAHIRTPLVACSPTPETFLVEKLEGVSLQSVCTVPPFWGLTAWMDSRLEILNRVGLWLKTFHAAGPAPGPAPLTGVKAYLRNREAALDAIGVDLAGALERALETAVSLAPVRVHGDFTPHNILVAGDTVAVIDLAGITEFETETRCFDVAAMIVGLEEAWRLRGRNHLRLFPAPMRRMIAGFVAASGVRDDVSALPVCYAVRHLTRAYNVLRRSGRAPGPRHWHVQRIRVALEHPEEILALAQGGVSH